MRDAREPRELDQAEHTHHSQNLELMQIVGAHHRDDINNRDEGGARVDGKPAA